MVANKNFLQILRHAEILLKLIRIRRLRRCQKFRRWWIRPYLKLRNYYGAFTTLFKYFKNNDQEEFEKLTRLSVKQFNILHILLKKKLKKKKVCREPLCSELRLAAVLW